MHPAGARAPTGWDLLNEAGVPCGPIYSVDQTFADPQVRHLEMEKAVEHPALGAVYVIDHAVNMSRTPPEMRRASPDAGEHTEEVLLEAGYSGGRDRRLPGPPGRIGRLRRASAGARPDAKRFSRARRNAGLPPGEFSSNWA